MRSYLNSGATLTVLTFSRKTFVNKNVINTSFNYKDVIVQGKLESIYARFYCLLLEILVSRGS